MAKKSAKKAVATPPEPEPSTFSKAKSAVVHAAEKVADVVSHAAESVKAHVVTPVAQAVGLKKKRKPRPKREKRPASKVPAPLARNTSAAGKMMSKNVKVPPKTESKGGTKSKGEL